MKIQIPENITKVIRELENNNFEVFVVGGSVRDLLLGIEPKDWDVTTNAKPKEIQKIFPESVYENEFGTVGVKCKTKNEKVKTTTQNLKQEKKEELQAMSHKPVSLADGSPVSECEIVEVTTYRIESKYTDKRHPDEVKFAETLEEDLSRRDFTVNAMALKVKDTRNKMQDTNKFQILNSKLQTNYQLLTANYEIVDLFNGQKDLKDKIIRAVGNAEERFNEDALRMMRAVRFASTLNQIPNEFTNDKLKITNTKTPSTPLSKGGGKWEIEEKTLKAIEKNVDNLKYISPERIRDEFNKIILSDQPAQGVDLLVETKLMKYIIPEIGNTIGVRQNRHHYYGPYNTVYKHMLASLEKCPSEKLEVRLASFLHDIGKPQSKRGKGEFSTFYSHEYIGARMVEKIMKRLKYSRKIIDKTVLLVKNHMFYYNVDEVGESGVRKVVRKVGLENIKDLIDVRIADRLGSGVPKAVPYKLRHFEYMVEKVSKDPTSVKQLKINGNDLIKELKIKPSPKIGAILDVLLAQVIDEPKLNTKKELSKLAKKLEKENLIALRKMAKEKIKEERKKEDEGIKGKYWVK